MAKLFGRFLLSKTITKNVYIGNLNRPFTSAGEVFTGIDCKQTTDYTNDQPVTSWVVIYDRPGWEGEPVEVYRDGVWVSEEYRLIDYGEAVWEPILAEEYFFRDCSEPLSALITYDGKNKIFHAGQTVTLECAEAIFATNIEVSILFTKPYTATLRYGGKVYSLTPQKTTRLKCAGLMAKSDIVISK